MNYLWEQWLINLDQVRLTLQVLDIALVLLLSYVVLVVIGDRRTLWMVRGLIFLMLAAALSKSLGLGLLGFVLDKLVVGSAVAMAFMLQGEFRRLLELLGQGQLAALLRPSRVTLPKPDSVIDEIVRAITRIAPTHHAYSIPIPIPTPTPMDAAARAIAWRDLFAGRIHCGLRQTANERE